MNAEIGLCFRKTTTNICNCYTVQQFSIILFRKLFTMLRKRTNFSFNKLLVEKEPKQSPATAAGSTSKV